MSNKEIKQITNPKDVEKYLKSLIDDDIIDDGTLFGVKFKSLNSSCWDQEGDILDNDGNSVESDLLRKIINNKIVSGYLTEYENNVYNLYLDGIDIRVTIEYIDFLVINLPEEKTKKILEDLENNLKTTEKETSTKMLGTGMMKFKQQAIDGVKIAIGNKAAGILQKRVITILEGLKIPSSILEHKLTKMAILVATPTLLKMILELVPENKSILKIKGVVDIAAISATSQVSTEILDHLENFLKPIIKELSAIGVSLTADTPKLTDKKKPKKTIEIDST